MMDDQQFAAKYRDAITAHYKDLGQDPDSPSIARTIATNTDLVPQRAGTLLDVIAALTDLGDLEDRVVLDLASGFGALTAYIALRASPRSIVGIDIREDYIAHSVGCARRFGVPGLEYRVGDMRSLPEPDDSVDVVVANNAIIYLPDGADLRQALSECHRVLRPGGWFVFRTANRWVFREPLSRAPIVHLLPRPLAAMMQATVGWRHNHGRVRYLGPGGVRRALRRAGFDEVTFGDVLDGQIVGRRRSSEAFLLGVARKPPSRVPDAESTLPASAGS